MRFNSKLFSISDIKIKWVCVGGGVGKGVVREKRRREGGTEEV